MDKTTVARLLRVSWDAVARIVVRVVAERIDEARLDELYRIGVDEISYRKGHHYLTVVADHDRDGAVVWAAEGQDHTVLKAFYDKLGKERRAKLQAVSLDLGGAYAKATAEQVPHVTHCIDPFHVGQLANIAIEKTRRQAWNTERATNPLPSGPSVGRRRKHRHRRIVPGASSTPGGRCSRTRTASARSSSRC